MNTLYQTLSTLRPSAPLALAAMKGVARIGALRNRAEASLKAFNDRFREYAGRVSGRSTRY